jgi:hypothetical protein
MPLIPKWAVWFGVTTRQLAYRAEGLDATEMSPSFSRLGRWRKGECRSDGGTCNFLEAKLLDLKESLPGRHTRTECPLSLVLTERTPTQGVCHEAQPRHRQTEMGGLGRVEGDVVPERNSVHRSIPITSNWEERQLASGCGNGCSIRWPAELPDGLASRKNRINLETT